MKPKKMSIAKVIFSAFATLIFLYALDGLTSFQAMRRLSGLTKTIYNHPLVVSNASLQANTNIIKIHRSMKDMVLFSTSGTIDGAVATITELEFETL